MVRLTINGVAHELDVDPDMPLLWAIRDAAGLTGTKFGCGIGMCGACTVHVDGVATRSCQAFAGDAEGAAITTIEGLSKTSDHPVQRAWVAEEVPQCGYCQSGMIMAVAGLLQEDPNPTDAKIDETITNVCRCGTYIRIRKAIHRAARLSAENEA